jgi:UDP-N-acetylmuramate: L-alanyl-gamma-D-glutamyl-meso-diaminopimelate ligase
MGALAILLKQAGHDVRGSDGPLYPPMSTQLERAEIPVFEGFGDANLEWGPDVVVVGNVCSKDHAEVLAAQARGHQLESFPSALGKLLLPERRPLVVAGTHGKTTTSTLVAWLLHASNTQPSWLIGGVPENLPRASHLGEGKAIVLEGDEYDTAFFDKESKFLHYQPHRAILTSVEFDHADIFDSIEDIRAAFRKFVELIPEDGDLVVHRDDSEAMGIAAHAKGRVSTYRVLPDHDDDVKSADYVVKVLRAGSSRRMDFEIYERGENLGRFSTSMSGRYNLANIAAAFAVARAEGVDVEPLRQAIRRFRGVKRRQALLGVAQGIRLLQDFAHHTTAVQSRRSVFFEGYTSAFDAASRVYLAPLHAPQKVPEDQRLDTFALADAISTRGITAKAFGSIEPLRDAVLERAAPGDTILFLTCGSFGGLPQMVMDGLGDAVTFGRREDVPAINQLLLESGLPALVDPDQVETLVIKDAEGRVVAAVNLQLAESSVYLFGLIVKPNRRGEGLGWVLADSVMRWARTLGAKSVCLIAGSSADYFADRLGFSVVAADDLPEDAKGLSNFKHSLRPDSICMIYELPAES